MPSDVPAALPALTNLSAALDYGTDHTYKRSASWSMSVLPLSNAMLTESVAAVVSPAPCVW